MNSQHDVSSFSSRVLTTIFFPSNVRPHFHGRFATCYKGRLVRCRAIYDMHDFTLCRLWSVRPQTFFALRVDQSTLFAIDSSVEHGRSLETFYKQLPVLKSTLYLSNGHPKYLHSLFYLLFFHAAVPQLLFH